MLRNVWSSFKTLSGRTRVFGAKQRPKKEQGIAAPVKESEDNFLARHSAYQHLRNFELVKPRPAGLDERYLVVTEEERLDTTFLGMRDLLFALANHQTNASVMPKTVFREWGQLDQSRPYIYLKPMNENGWLLERSGSGWLVTRAEKIINQDLFLRTSADPWDIAVLLEHPEGKGLPRVKSSRFGPHLLPLDIYQARLLEGLAEQLGTSH